MIPLSSAEVHNEQQENKCLVLQGGLWSALLALAAIGLSPTKL